MSSLFVFFFNLTFALYISTSLLSIEWVSQFYGTSLSPHGFPDSSVVKEFACKAGDPGLFPGLERGIGYPLQYSWASLVAQLVKNLPAKRETWVWSLAWEYPLEEGKATHSSILTWKIPWTIQSMGTQRAGHDWATFFFFFFLILFYF